MTFPRSCSHMRTVTDLIWTINIMKGKKHARINESPNSLHPLTFVIEFENQWRKLHLELFTKRISYQIHVCLLSCSDKYIPYWQNDTGKWKIPIYFIEMSKGDPFSIHCATNLSKWNWDSSKTFFSKYVDFMESHLLVLHDWHFYIWCLNIIQ